MRVLFTVVPGWGHIHPIVPLARSFVDQGDEVLWATGPDVAGRLVGEGFVVAAAGLTFADSFSELARRFPELQSIPAGERPDFMFAKLFGAVRAGRMLDDLLPLADDWEPELVVNDQAELAGPIVAASRGIAHATHSFGPLLPAVRVARGGEAVAGLWEAQGLEPRPYAGCYDHLYVDIYPASLQPQDRSHLRATQLVRPGAFALPGDEDLPALVRELSDTPLVYVTFGTVFADLPALATVVAAVRDLDVRVIVTIGPSGDPTVLGPQPANVHVARYIPQARLLPHCAAVVSHAGSGTFLAALAAGLPQLCLPMAADQFLNGIACERSGVGLTLSPGEVSVRAVGDAVERLLSDRSFRAAARRGSDEIAAMPPPAEAADRLRQLAS
jgi:UDP:flavonoid glycosyltransferase YjiC (YdhE family)